jgi:hypothetical protein
MRLIFSEGDTLGTSEEFPQLQPPLSPGDVVMFVYPAITLAGEHYQMGDTIEIIERTWESPYRRITTEGNVKVRGKDRRITVWSNIEWCIAKGQMRRVSEGY